MDAKVWTTLIPLLIKPGKVSRDFINGKRSRYTNPFQFYISVSIIFFLILGAANKYQEFQDFESGEVSTGNFNIVNFDKPNIRVGEDAIKSLDSVIQNEKVDSIINSIDFENNLKGLDSVDRENALKFIKNGKDSISNIQFTKASFDSLRKQSTVLRMIDYQKKNPDHSINRALDSLKMKKTLWNRFLYTRADRINSFQTNTEEENKKLSKEVVSYASIAIFIFLPIFTLFLKVIYARRSFSYVEHLIFVFHTQTVFFLLSGIFFLLWLFTHNSSILPIFLILFLIYLFIAMKQFYRQGFFKTLFKYLFINFVFLMMGSIGFMIVAVIAFAIY